MRVMIFLQIALDLLLGGLVLWCLWRKGDGCGQRLDPRIDEDELEREVRRWECVSEELVCTMRGRLKELETLLEELDRAEIRAGETLKRLEEAGGLVAQQDPYGRATSLIRDGVALEEVAMKTGLGLGELRTIQKFRSCWGSPR
ncbi:MAG: hypothetical protein ACUVXD_17510 [Thermodesulfobacteriota bacterium]